ncbi:hypothetical protein RHSIM_Rhsim11G0116000 [Rhododendron simsii]|uniref:NAC domain-containing protein n=1 Tax=Rhododendron simsii TaxID=118357 RepID=A0A834G6K7_RHOSS|nr:hypothetical protein RHSIM_Rhsim11G0116000 [Rhododendron simsii]
MSVPVGYRFTPTDQELVIDYLRKKSKGAEALPCDVVFEREIYGTGNKAPWQIFTENDPWEEGSVYVLTKLIKARGSDKRIARTAGCGSWHGETGPEPIYDKQTGPDNKKTDPKLIGYKRMLRFQITNELGAMDESVGKGYWTMHEFSLPPDGNSTSSTRKQSPKREFVLCRIKRDGSRDTKIVKCTKKSTRKAENIVEAAATSDADVIMVRKPAKRARKEEFEQEQKVEAQETEAVPYSRELSEAEKEGNHSWMLSAEEFLEVERQGNYSQRLSDMDADLEELVSILQWEPLPKDPGAVRHSHDSWRLGNHSRMLSAEEFLEVERQGNYSQRLSDMDADLEELVSILQWEPLPSFDLNFDALGPQVVADKFCLV